MAKLEYFLVSESVSVDQQSNRASLFNVLEELQWEKFPSAIPSSVAVSAWNQEPGDEGADFQVMLVVHLPGQEQRLEFPSNMSLTKPRHRLMQTIIGLSVPAPGDVIYEILLNGQHVASHTVTVHQLDRVESRPGTDGGRFAESSAPSH